MLAASVFFLFILPQLSKKASTSPGANEGSSSQAGVVTERTSSEPSSLNSSEQKILEKAQEYFFRIQAKLDEKDQNGTERIFHKLELEDHISDLNGLPAVAQVQRVRDDLARIKQLHHENGFDKNEYRLIEYRVYSKSETAKEIAANHRVSAQEIIKFNPRSFDRGGRIMLDKNGALPTLIIYQKR
ncbi:hypothetical protein [Lewinella sp. LCG006]|uniref:hypothetical protein n=1 Tax=Lewinella sp. LCG006 TaxID=3231911 RepID=UPI003460CE4B